MYFSFVLLVKGNGRYISMYKKILNFALVLVLVISVLLVIFLSNTDKKLKAKK